MKKSNKNALRMAMAAGYRVWFPQSVTHLVLPSAWHKIPKTLKLSVMFISLTCVYECVYTGVREYVCVNSVTVFADESMCLN